MNSLQNMKILFCGSSELSIGVLEFLKTKNVFPHTIITQPDRPVGRERVVTETIVSSWVHRENSNNQKIRILKPETIDGEFLTKIQDEKFDLCLVASYGTILKEKFLNIFPKSVWNVHPSALPLYRGATPLQAQVIDGLKEIQITVIKMDTGMDSGKILAKEKMDFNWENKSISILEEDAGYLGGQMFYENFDESETLLKAQDHTRATFTKILKKEDGNVTEDLNNKNIELIWRKYNAFRNWPGLFFFQRNTRIKITQMQKDIVTGEIHILKLLPESKKEISLRDFENSYEKLF